MLGSNPDEVVAIGNVGTFNGMYCFAEYASDGYVVDSTCSYTKARADCMHNNYFDYSYSERSSMCANAGTLVNLKVLNLQNLQFMDSNSPFGDSNSPFTDAVFSYKAEDPNKVYTLDPNSNQNFVHLPGYCEGQGCQLVNLKANLLFLI